MAQATKAQKQKARTEYMNEICLGMIQRLYYEKIPHIFLPSFP